MKPSGLEYITIGQVLAPWGLEGKLKVEVITDFPHRLAPRSQFYVDRQPMTIAGTSWHKGKAIIKLEGIDSVEQAEKLRGKTLEIHHRQLETLPEGQYYHFQLIGLEVWTTEGKRLGKVIRVLSAPSNDNYVVGGEKGEILIPAIEDVVKSVDLESGRITIEAIEGLLDLNG
ncbi:MAG: 16S rRNA processing protein RimM [Dehalococcoidia bacterium]|nr:MAG: 16S rRNA processing protein RimM [Dehalococcoidia bacterium]